MKEKVINKEKKVIIAGSFTTDRPGAPGRRSMMVNRPGGPGMSPRSVGNAR